MLAKHLSPMPFDLSSSALLLRTQLWQSENTDLARDVSADVFINGGAEVAHHSLYNDLSSVRSVLISQTSLSGLAEGNQKYQRLLHNH